MILTGITWDHPRGYDPLAASSALYEKLYGVKVIWQKRSLTDFGDQSLTGLANRFDLLVMDHPHVGVAAETGCLRPLNELIPAAELDGLREQAAGPCFTSYTYQGKQWAIPVDAAMQCSASRPDLINGLAAPDNWEEVFELAGLLKRKNLQVGTALCPTDSLCTFLTLTAQFGSPLKEGNKVLVKPETGIQSLELMRRMRDTFHPDCLNWNPIQLYDCMSGYDGIAYSPLAFCYTNYSRKGFRKNRLTYGNAPGTRNALLGGAGIAVSAKSKYADEAAKYIAWVCGAEIQSSVYVTEQGQPANTAAWDNKIANDLTANFFINSIGTLKQAYTRPRYSGWPAFQTYMGKVLHSFLKADSNPAQILEQLQDEYNQSYK